MVSGLSGVLFFTVTDELEVLDVDVEGSGVVGGGVGRLVLLMLLGGSTASTAYALKDIVVPLTALTAPDGTSYPSG